MGPRRVARVRCMYDFMSPHVWTHINERVSGARVLFHSGFPVLQTLSPPISFFFNRAVSVRTTQTLMNLSHAAPPLPPAPTSIRVWLVCEWAFNFCFLYYHLSPFTTNFHAFFFLFFLFFSHPIFIKTDISKHGMQTLLVIITYSVITQ